MYMILCVKSVATCLVNPTNDLWVSYGSWVCRYGTERSDLPASRTYVRWQIITSGGRCRGGQSLGCRLAIKDNPNTLGIRLVVHSTRRMGAAFGSLLCFIGRLTYGKSKGIRELSRKDHFWNSTSGTQKSETS